MMHQQLAPELVLRTYLGVLHQPILNARMRIRYGESIEMDELHDLLDAIHNIPEMLSAYGDWYVEENIDNDLRRYDDRWCKPGDTSRRRSLKTAMERAREMLPGAGGEMPE